VIPLTRPLEDSEQSYIGRENIRPEAEDMPVSFKIVPNGKGSRTAATSAMHPYGLEIIENCVTRPHREDRLFCDLSSPALLRLSEITSASSYPKGATLFVEGQSPRGVFILLAGRVKLSTSSIDGRTLIVRISEPGEVLGLPATITGTSYELTAAVVESVQTNFISRPDFLGFLREHGEVSLRVAQQLGASYHAAITEMRSIGLSRSVGEKLARFLLDWCVSHGNGTGEIRSQLTMTHEEIAEMIGASRETVTRLLTAFKKKDFLQIKGSTLIIRNKSTLENFIDSRE
jgi:CRP/FNR family transcriptional regulator, cyclic AMP receptor protein